MAHSNVSRKFVLVRLHAGASIGIGVVLIIALISSVVNPDVQKAFRAQPTNFSYEVMTFALVCPS